MKNSDYNNEPRANDDVDSLAREADRRRERIEQTLNVLGGKLSPENLKEQAFDLFSEHGGDIATSLQRSVKNNPVPLLLTGVGIAWMMMSQRDDRYGSDQRRHYSEFRQPATDTRYIPHQSAFSDRHSTDHSSGENISDKLGSARDSVMDSASDTWDSVTDSARDARDAVTDSARDARDSTGERLDSMREQSAAMSNQMRQQYRSASHSAGQMADEWASDASRFMREQPLVAGALGIAIGALLGGLMPTSEKERQLARRAVNSDAGQSAIKRSEEVLETVKAEASSRIEQAGEFAKEKAREVKESAKSEA